MRKFKVAGIAAMFLAASAFTGCDILKDLEYNVSPDPLEMHGDSVRVTITATVPEKGLHKKAVVEITPMIGDTPLRTVVYQGEKAEGNGKVIPFKAGGKITYTDVIAYADAMEVTELKVKIIASKKGKEKENFVTDPLADGTIITPYLIMNDDMVLMADDKFVRDTDHSEEATINYLKDRSEVRTSELREDDIVAFKEFIEEGNENDRIEFNKVVINAYASPEGEISRNNGLADDRAASAQKAVMRMMKDIEVEGGQEESMYAPKGNGEDWEGFKAAMQASDIEDKDVVLRILSKYTGEEREEQIKNIAETYTVIKKDILPGLRRSNISLNYTLHGKTDEELKALSKSKPDSLTIEELLFTATLVDDLDEKLRIYREAAKNYPGDWRAHNNVGYILFLQNKVQEAKGHFETAAQKEDNSIVKNNLGACTRIGNGERNGGDRNKALELFQESTSAGKEVSYNIGLVHIQNGNYGEAVTSMGDYATFNKALAQLLAGDTNGALSTLDNSDDKETAMGYYLKAVAGARQGNKEMVVNNLKSAVSKDSSLKEKAAIDREFIKYFEDADFKATVN